MISRSLSLRTLVLATLVALAPAVGAQTPPWTPIGPFGGSVSSITPDPVTAGVLYASTGVGVYKTADAGASWSLILAVPLFSGRVAVDPLHPSILYLTGASLGASLDAMVLKSADGGAHWSPADAGLPRYNAVLAVDPARPRRLYAGSVGFWRSLDAGASWQLAGAGTLPGGDQVLIESIAAAPRPAGKILAGTQSGVYRSNDGGTSWSVVDGLPPSLARAIAFAPSDPRIVYAGLTRSGLPGAGGLYRSTDGGVSWRRVLSPKPVYAAQEISISPRSPRIVYARFEDRSLYRSTDGGDHWTRLQAAGQADAVAADPHSAATVWSSLTSLNTGGVWRSDNQGKTWAARSAGMTGIATTSLAIDPRDPERLWTTTSLGPLRTTNGGARWTGVRTPRGETGILRVAAGPGSRVIALTYNFPPGEEAPPATYRLWQTNDGVSWTRLLGPLPSNSRVRTAPSDPSTVYVLAVGSVSATKLYRSTDGGATWTALTGVAPLLGCGVGDLTVSPSDPEVLYLTGSGPTAFGCKPPALARVFRSDDGGATWTGVSTGLPSDTALTAAVGPRDPRTVYASLAFVYTGAGEGVWKSTDGGASWHRTGNEIGEEKVTSLLVTLSGRVYAAAGNRVFRSDDGGATWEDWSAGLRVTGVSELVADPDDPRRIYAVTTNGIWALTEAD